MGKRTQLDRRNEFKLLLYRKVIRVNILSVMSVCVCARACACACVCMCVCLCVYVCIHIQSAGPQAKGVRSPELELYVIVCHCMGAGNRSLPLQKKYTLLISKSFLQL